MSPSECLNRVSGVEGEVNSFGGMSLVEGGAAEARDSGQK
jgi:hypothetical protein